MMLQNKFQAIKRILIANRGEIVNRILRTAKKMGIETVVVYAYDDRKMPYVKDADVAICLDGNLLSDTYLNQALLLSIAKKNKVDAIHPGYGFLSENYEFAQKVFDHKLIWIGPKPEVIRMLGNKPNARQLADELNIPVIKVWNGDVDKLKRDSSIIFPVIIKPSNGGGGKGMRIAHNKKELSEFLNRTSAEALRYFGDASVYLEQYLPNARHIEVQILADEHGNVVHLYERECSVQRRYQKIIEECPAVNISNAVKQKLYNASLQIAKASNYCNAGTVEFLITTDEQFFFLEMNTRIQVEHPVTEEVTGVDLVEQQLEVASHNVLSLQQHDISINGHSIEVRIYAENPSENFIPSDGKIAFFTVSSSARFESALYPQMEVSTGYDPMLAKLIVKGNNRSLAIAKLQTALNNTIIHGIRSNISFLSHIVELPDFSAAQIHINWCDALVANYHEEISPLVMENISIAYAIAKMANRVNVEPECLPGVWKNVGYWRMSNRMNIETNGNKLYLEWRQIGEGELSVFINEKELHVHFEKPEGNIIYFTHKQERLKVVWTFEQTLQWYFTLNGMTFSVQENIRSNRQNRQVESNEFIEQIFSPLPGKVIKINTKAGSKVKKGDSLMVIESMKMENVVIAQHDSVIKCILVKEGQQLKAKDIVLEFENN